jgi:hypothetical protein
MKPRVSPMALARSTALIGNLAILTSPPTRVLASLTTTEHEVLDVQRLVEAPLVSFVGGHSCLLCCFRRTSTPALDETHAA